MQHGFELWVNKGVQVQFFSFFSFLHMQLQELLGSATSSRTNFEMGAHAGFAYSHSNSYSFLRLMSVLYPKRKILLLNIIINIVFLIFFRTKFK